MRRRSSSSSTTRTESFRRHSFRTTVTGCRCSVPTTCRGGRTMADFEIHHNVMDENDYTVTQSIENAIGGDVQIRMYDGGEIPEVYQSADGFVYINGIEGT